MATTLNSEVVLNALRSVQDPDLHKDLVTLDMVRDLTVEPDGSVKLRVVLTTPACPMKAKIESDVREALASVGATKVELKMDAEVRRSAAPTQTVIPGVKHVIAVSSGKGGVGKSTVAVNLAYALASEGARVGLMDADIHGPNIPTMVGIQGPPNIEEGADGVERFIPPVAHGVKVVSMGMLVNPDQPMIWRGPMLHNAVKQFCHQVKWADELGAELDYLIVDMPPGTGDVQLSLAQMVPVAGAVMVTTPQEVSVQDVKRAFTMWAKVNVPVIGVVENMSYFVCDGCTKKHALFGDGGGVLLAKRYNVHLLAKLPLVPAVREGGDRGLPIVLRDPDCEVSVAFKGLSRTVAQQIEIRARQFGKAGETLEIRGF